MNDRFIDPARRLQQAQQLSNALYQGMKQALHDSRQVFAAPQELGCPRQLQLETTSANNVDLAAAADSNTPRLNTFVNVINGQADFEAPREIILRSLDDAPFDVRVRWTSGGGDSGQFFATASGGRFQYFQSCLTLNVAVANWTGAENRIRGFVSTNVSGVYPVLHRAMRQLTLAAGATADFAVPPFARLVDVGCSNPAQQPNLRVSMLDSANVAMASWFADFGTLKVGSASTVRITNDDPGQVDSFMLDFTLAVA